MDPGPTNGLTDVAGVRVGHSTLIEDRPCPEDDGEVSVRTGVTAIWPIPGDIFAQRVVGGSFVLNGAGELSGLVQVREWGVIETPILLTNTHAVGAVSYAAVEYMAERFAGVEEADDLVIPLVGECDDSFLNDIAVHPVGRRHVFEALDGATDGPVAEGNVGGGTGMVSFDLKGGIGTSSRVVPEGGKTFTLGVLVMNNCGRLQDLRVDGVPVGPALAEHLRDESRRPNLYGSIIVVVGTDAPLMSHQLDRISKRAGLGLGRVGSYAAHGSGEIIVAFSTANKVPRRKRPRTFELKALSEAWMDPLYRATVECTEEAVLNSLCLAETMQGVGGRTIPAMPLDLVETLVAQRRPVELTAPSESP
jgi:D-aminopeptidase